MSCFCGVPLLAPPPTAWQTRKKETRLLSKKGHFCRHKKELCFFFLLLFILMCPCRMCVSFWGEWQLRWWLFQCVVYAQYESSLPILGTLRIQISRQLSLLHFAFFIRLFEDDKSWLVALRVSSSLTLRDSYNERWLLWVHDQAAAATVDKETSN